MSSSEINPPLSKIGDWETHLPPEPLHSEGSEQAAQIGQAPDPDESYHSLEKKLSLHYRAKNAAHDQFQSFQEAQKNKMDFSCLINHVSQYWPEDSWVVLFTNNEKEWIQWVRHEAKFTQEMVQLKRLEKLRIETWSEIAKNFHLFLKGIQQRTLEGQDMTA